MSADQSEHVVETGDLNEYVVTFGVQYGQVVHLVLPGITGDHYISVFAHTEHEARVLLKMILGERWSFIYPVQEFDTAKWAPAGRFLTLEVGDTEYE